MIIFLQQKFGLFVTRFTKPLPSMYLEAFALGEFWAGVPRAPSG